MEKRKHSDLDEEGAASLGGLIGPLVSLLGGLIGPLVSLLGGLIGLIAANPEAISPHRHEEHHYSDEDIEEPPHNPSDSQGGSHTSFG